MIRHFYPGVLLIPLLLIGAEPQSVEQLFNLRTVTVEKRVTEPTLSAYGYIRADETRTYDIAPRFGGYVEILYADARFDRIRKGAPLAKVYAPEVLQAKEDYLSALRFNRQRPADAKTMLRGVKEKLELLGISNTEIDAVNTTMHADALTTIHAPVSGWLFVKNVRKGSAFQAAQTLFTLVDLDQVWVEARFDQQDMEKLGAMQTYTVHVTGLSEAFKASRPLLYPDIDPKRATVTLRLVIDNPGTKLFPGMYATVTAKAEPKALLTVPRTAVIRRDNGWYVFRSGDFKGIYDPVRIEGAPLDAEYFRITSGLHEGDRVVDDALFMMDADAQMSGLY